MVDEVKQVRGLMLPLQGFRLLLPDSIILQIVTSVEIMTLEDTPGWLLGTVTWQKRVIPVLSFEVAAGQQHEQMETPRMLILKSINNIEKMPFYAIMLAGIPTPAVLSDENLTRVENASISSPLILSEVLVDGEPGSIPNLDALEEMLMSQYGQLAEKASAE